MSISDLVLVYLWLVLVMSCILLVRNFFTSETRKAWTEVKEAWHGIISINDEQRTLERDFRHIKGWLSSLLRSGFDRSFVVIHHRGSERFIQFRKYIHARGDYGIELGFPKAVWSEDYFRKVEAHCQESGTPYRVAAESNGDSCIQFLHVDCGKDVETALELTRSIWTSIFGLREDTPHRIEDYGISRWNESVDHPKQRPLTFSEGLRCVDGVDSPAYAALALHAAWTLLRPVAFFGLLIALVSAPGKRPDWQINLGSVDLGGTIASAAFLCLYLASIAGYIIWGRYWGHPDQKMGTWFDEKILPPWNWAVRTTLPVSALLIWASS